MRHRNDPQGLAGRKLYLGGLLEDVRKEELTKELARFGPLDDVWIARNPPGFAFVVYQRDADAERCVRALDGMNVCGSRIRAEFAHRLNKDAPPFGRSREPPFERNARGRSDHENERGSSSRAPPLSSRSQPQASRSFQSDRSDRRYSRDAPRRNTDARTYRTRSPPPDHAAADDFDPPARIAPYRSRSTHAGAGDFEPPYHRDRAPTSGDYRESRRRSPCSPPSDVPPRRYPPSSGSSYRRGAPSDEDEGYARARPNYRSDRDRSPLGYRTKTSANANDEYAGYYGNQTPPSDEESGLPPANYSPRYDAS